MCELIARKFMKRTGSLAFRMIIVLSILVLAVCSKDKTTEPVEQTTDNELLYMELFNSGDTDSIVMAITDSAEIGVEITPGIADSAAFSLEDEDNYILIPDSAITDSAAISIQFNRLRFIHGNDSTLSALVFECTPDGQVFSESLIFDIFVGYFNNNTNSNAVKLYLYDPAAKHWNLESTKHKNDPRLRFNIAHFSKYAISD
jgi:hypothetical protein